MSERRGKGIGVDRRNKIIVEEDVSDIVQEGERVKIDKEHFSRRDGNRFFILRNAV